MPGLVYRLGTQEDCDMVPALGKLIAEKHVNRGDESIMEGTREASGGGTILAEY